MPEQYLEHYYKCIINFRENENDSSKYILKNYAITNFTPRVSVCIFSIYLVNTAVPILVGNHKKLLKDSNSHIQRMIYHKI